MHQREMIPISYGEGMPQVPTAYVCKGFTCLPPVRDEEELKKILGR